MMEKVKAITTYILLLGVSRPTTANLSVVKIDVRQNPTYIRKYGEKLVNFSTCKDFDFFDYEQGPNDFGDCHVTQLEGADTIENIFPGATSCCPHHGFMGSANCEGRDKDGGQATYSNFKVCAKHEDVIANGMESDENRNYKLRPLDCPLEKGIRSGQVSKGQLTVQKNKNTNKTSLLVNNEIFDVFCLGHTCNDDGVKWTFEYLACENLTTEDKNKNVKGIFSGALCCGDEGALSITTDEEVSCDNGDPLPPALANCTWRNKQTLVVTELSSTNHTAVDFLCASSVQDKARNFLGGVECKEDCRPPGACFRSCFPEKQARHLGNNSNVSILEDFNFFKVLGFSANINYNVGVRAPINQCNSDLYPEDSCDPENMVQFFRNGSMRVARSGEVLDYGQFCIGALAGRDWDGQKGSFMVRACVQQSRQEEGQEDKFNFYFVILSISIVCLAATIAIYTVFRSALLSSDYNKIMINFAISLLLAFLVLVILQAPAPGGNQLLPSIVKTKIVCTVLALVNQFFILSAFFWMTLMSYEIFRQIHGMKVIMIGQSSRILWRKAPIGYGIPGVICLITLLVELTAPRCAAIRPKFGYRSCLFFGGLDKFIWLYLPILVLLLINTFTFIYISINILKNRNTESMTNKNGKRMERFDQMCLYLRLFLGMGIIWYFELLAFAVGDYAHETTFYFTDVFNMLQGVWVFLIFVCKRNVLKVVTRKTDVLYSKWSRTRTMSGTRTSMGRNNRLSSSVGGNSSATGVTEGVSVSGVTDGVSDSGVMETGF